MRFWAEMSRLHANYEYGLGKGAEVLHSKFIFLGAVSESWD